MQTKVHKMPNSITPLEYQWKEPPNKIYVVAGNSAEMDAYRLKKIREGSKDNYYYVQTPESLRGLSTIKGVFIGTWAQRKDIHLIQEQIKLIKARMVQDEAMVKAAGIIAQEIDTTLINSYISNPPNNGLTATQTLSINQLNTSTSIGSSPPYLTESSMRDMMKKYIDEYLSNQNPGSL